jgi:outer membrane scaffolding protein for murein synthesis (MipA/OmpV family)
MNLRALGCIALTLGCCAALGAAESPEARVELGLSAVVLHLPDYRGSDRYGARFLPIPYLVYRSERVQVTREGLRAWLFSTDRLSLSLSAAASLPGDADDNPLRAGMPELDPTFEAGPSLDLRFHESADGAFRTRLRLPLRAVLATDGGHFNSVGWVLNPHLRADLSQDRNGWGISHVAAAGPLWATEEYHEYFYGVAPQHEDFSLNRPAYDAHGGYSGARMSLSSGFERARWRFGVFATYDWLRSAVFDDSPLLETGHSFVSGFYLAYRLYQSGVAPPSPMDETAE